MNTYVYTITLRHETQGFNKTVSVEAGDVWRAVEGSFEQLDAAGRNPDDFAVTDLRRGAIVKLTA